MGSFAPIFLAFLLNRYGIHIFREPSAPCNGPLLSFCIFLISVFILLWDMRLYPKSLRRLWKCGYLFLEFLIADFIMEHLVSDFWFPLEAAVLLSLIWVGQSLEDTIDMPAYATVYDTLKSKPVGIVASYCLSCFFLIAVLHATRAIDLRLTECGIGVFFKAIFIRLKRGARKIISPFRRRNKVDIDDLCDGLMSPDDQPECDSERPVYEKEQRSSNRSHKHEVIHSHHCNHDHKQPQPSPSSSSRRRRRKQT